MSQKQLEELLKPENLTKPSRAMVAPPKSEI
jgi:hypothetical protein